MPGKLPNKRTASKEERRVVEEDLRKRMYRTTPDEYDQIYGHGVWPAARLGKAMGDEDK